MEGFFSCTHTEGAALLLARWLESVKINQDFLMADPSSLALSIERQATGLHLNWHGIQRVSYQLLCSTNLVDWAPYGLPLVGAGKTLDSTYPFWSGPARFFRLKLSR